MTAIPKLLFFLMILVVCGSIVTMSVRQLNRIHAKTGKGDPAQVRALISDLRGERFATGEDVRAMIDPRAIPQRKEGQVLHGSDRKLISSVIRKVVPVSGEGDK